MTLVEQVTARRSRLVSRRPSPAPDGALAWPAGPGSVPSMGSTWGHRDTRFTVTEYGDYAATSNEVYSVISLRARLLSTLQPRFYRGRDADKAELGTHPAARLLRYVNPHWTLPRLLWMDEMSMCLWGSSFWALESTRGKPSEIWWLKPTQVKPVPDDSGYIAGYLYEPEYGGDQIPFTTDEVLWFRYPNPIDQFSALSPLAAARLAADSASAMQKSNRNLFTQGLQMGGLIVPTDERVTFSPEQSTDLSDQLERRWSGVDAAHRWAVLRYGAKMMPMNITPKDAEFVQGMNLSLRQVCNAYGVPSVLLNDYDTGNVAYVKEMERRLWSMTLVPDAKLRAAEIEEQYLKLFANGPDHVEWDWSQVPALQDSMSETWARDASAIDRGALTINEWRRRNGLPPVAWGDEWLAPMNKRFVDAPDDPGGVPVPSSGGTPPGDGNGTAGEDKRGGQLGHSGRSVA